MLLLTASVVYWPAVGVDEIVARVVTPLLKELLLEICICAPFNTDVCPVTG